MALITCPECGKQVFTAAKACPACGYPVAEKGVPTTPSPVAQASALDAVDGRAVLLEVRPSWWNYGRRPYVFSAEETPRSADVPSRSSFARTRRHEPPGATLRFHVLRVGTPALR